MSHENHSSKKVIQAAAIANFIIAIAKFIGAFFTGSAAMFGEGVHSLVDTSNQFILLLGLKIAAKPADEKRPSGYGRVMYVCSFFVALILFGLGAIYTGFEAIHSIKAPGVVGDPLFVSIALGILLVSIFVEGKSWYIAYSAFKYQYPDTGIWQGLRELKDPAVLVVLLEDTAAMLGLAIAFIGLGTSFITGNALWDAYATLGIAILLGLVAAFLFVECISMILGEAANPKTRAEIRKIILSFPKIKHINKLVTEYIGPKELRVLISIDFESDIKSDRIEHTNTDIEKALKDRFSDISDVWVEVQSFSDSKQDEKNERVEHKDRY